MQDLYITPSLSEYQVAKAYVLTNAIFRPRVGSSGASCSKMPQIVSSLPLEVLCAGMNNLLVFLAAGLCKNAVVVIALVYVLGAQVEKKRK